MALKLKFPNIRTDDVVRIRSATVDETATTKRVLNLSHYSNILTFPAGAKLVKDLKNKVHDEAEKGAGKKGGIQSTAVVVSEVDKKWANL